MFINYNRSLRSSCIIFCKNQHKTRQQQQQRIKTFAALHIQSVDKYQLLANQFSPIIVSRNSSSLSPVQKMLTHLPFFACGEIVAGFGRGSKDLGIPTANYPLEVVKSLPEAVQPGVYYGWANVDHGPVHKMVMSIGWNPFYDNKEKSMETHILHKFNKDLYGCLLKVCIVGYLRPEKNFKSLDDLIACIKQDIAQAEDLLETIESNKNLKCHDYFLDSNGCASNQINDKDTKNDI